MPYLEEMVVDLKPDVRCSAAWLIGVGLLALVVARKRAAG
jgi:hypothetical protein